MTEEIEAKQNNTDGRKPLLVLRPVEGYGGALHDRQLLARRGSNSEFLHYSIDSNRGRDAAFSACSTAEREKWKA